MRVGSTKNPGRSRRRPPRTSSPPCSARRVDRGQHRDHRLLADERPHQDTVAPGFADHDAAVNGIQSLDDLVVNRVVHDQPANGSAALAGRPDGRERGCAEGQLKIGGRRDDDRIVAAKLEDRAAQAAADNLADAPAHAATPSRGNQRRARVGKHASRQYPRRRRCTD